MCFSVRTILVSQGEQKADGQVWHRTFPRQDRTHSDQSTFVTYRFPHTGVHPKLYHRHTGCETNQVALTAMKEFYAATHA